MCSENAAIGVKQHFGDCLEACPSSVHNTFSPDFDYSLTLLGRTKTYFEKQIELFSSLLRRGILVFTLKVGFVSIANRELIEEVKEHSPYTISWSNIIDYVEPIEFHTIARQMSGPNTVHTAHSCNWSQLVYGTDAYDINNKVRLHFYAAGLKTI